jgi:hypothetical protein
MCWGLFLRTNDENEIGTTVRTVSGKDVFHWRDLTAVLPLEVSFNLPIYVYAGLPQVLSEVLTCRFMPADTKLGGDVELGISFFYV